MRLGWVIAGVLFAAVPSAGAQAPMPLPTVYDDPANPGWTCRPVPGAVTQPGEPGPVQCETRRTVPLSPSRSSSSWTPVLVALVWGLVPMLLAVRVVVSRDESVVIAIVLTFILGWIGFILVWLFLGRRGRHEAALRGGP